MQDVFDVPALTGLMRDIGSRTVRVVQVDTPSASPFARSLLFGYVAQFLYEGDSPLAERRAAALAMDPSLLADLLGHGEGAALRDLLDPQVVDATEQELQRLTPERAARDAEDVVDLLRALGPLPADEIAVRTLTDARDQVPQWLAHLEQTRQVFQARWGGVDHFAAIEDAGRLRDALGVGLPPGIATAFTDSVPDPLGDLLARYARTHGPFGIDDIAQHFGLGRAVAGTGCRRLVTDGRLVEGELRPDGATGGLDLCDPQVLRLLRRRSLASLRAEVEPVPAQDFARFLPAWQAVGSGQRGMDGLFRAVEQLAGARLPASALETLVLPARVARYTPALLDEAMSSGEVLWQGHAALPGDDGWVSLHLADAAPLTLLVGEGGADSPLHEAVRGALTGGGAFFFRPLLDAVRRAGQEKVSEKELVAALWDLVWAGEVSGDTIAALRARLGGGRPAHRSRSRGPRRARYGRPGGISLGSGLSGGGATPADAAGRWTLLPQPDSNVTARALARAEVLLDRYGVVTRGSVTAEGVDGGFAGVYRVLAAAEEAGRVRRGYFIEGLGAAQFASGGAVDRLRAASKPIGTTRNPWDGPAPVDQGRTLVLAAADPANPYGAALPWPDRELDPAVGDLGKTPRSGHKPGRKAGALVVLVDGALVLYVERGGRTLLSYSADPVDLRAAADALALAVREGALGALTVRSADGDPVLGSDQPLAAALAEAGFHVTPRGLRIRT